MQQPFHIELLLHAGADPSLSDRNGNTPAHLAVINNSLEALRSLIKYLRPGVTAANPFPELDYLNFDGEWGTVFFVMLFLDAFLLLCSCLMAMVKWSLSSKQGQC